MSDLKNIFNDIWRVVEKTRNERLTDDFGYDPNHVDSEEWTHEDPLLGYCHENAELLARRLSQEGYDPEIIWGGLIQPGTEPPETVKEAESLGIIHFWVELSPNNTDKNVIAELSKEYTGWPQVTQNLPDHYVRLPESRITYERGTVTSKTLRNEEGYQHLKNEGLVETATPISPETDTDAPQTRDPVTAFITGYINYYVNRGESPPLDNQSQSLHDDFTIPGLATLMIAAYETGRRSGSALRHFTSWVRNRFSRSGTDTPARTLSTDTDDE
jgi:hypothetical protein